MKAVYKKWSHDDSRFLVTVIISALLIIAGVCAQNVHAGPAYDVTIGLNNGAVITLSGTAPNLTIAGNAYTVINSLGVESDVSTNTAQGMKNNRTGRYALGNNIDASTTATWNSGLGLAPAGDSTTYFTGAFDTLKAIAKHVIRELKKGQEGG